MTTAASRDEIAARVLGTGLAMSSVAGVDPLTVLGFDLVWSLTADGDRSDLALVRGGDNLAQDLTLALLTATGSDPFNVRFGFDGLLALTGDYPSPVVRQLLQAAIMRTLAADPRIKDVLDVTLEPSSEAESAQRAWTVTAQVQTVLGDALVLTLGKVDLGG